MWWMVIFTENELSPYSRIATFCRTFSGGFVLVWALLSPWAAFTFSHYFSWPFVKRSNNYCLSHDKTVALTTEHVLTLLIDYGTVHCIHIKRDSQRCSAYRHHRRSFVHRGLLQERLWFQRWRLFRFMNINNTKVIIIFLSLCVFVME